MKLPAKPPDVSAILKHRPELLQQLFGSAPLDSMSGGGLVRGRYVHWDKLRRLTPPEGLSSEAWWASLKLARRASSRPIPLLSTSGDPFQLTVPDLAIEQLHHLDRDAGSQIMVSEDVANPDSRKRYVVSSLMEEAITSSQIEGAATTRRVAKDMLRSGRPPRDKSERMILNNYLAMQRISQAAKQPLTPDLVFELHRILGQDSLDVPDAVGRLRRPDENIAVYGNDFDQTLLHTPPPAAELPQRILAMCDFANGKTPERYVHPIVRAITLHFWLAYDHPFVDGNGRCARALFYWAMLRNGYWLAEFISISSVIRKAQTRYGRAFLYVETDDFDLTYFLLYHLDIIRRSIHDLHEHLKRKLDEVRSTEKRLQATATSYNHRQLTLLSHALRHPDATYTISSHQTSHNVVYQTARTDLLDLVHRNLLTKTQRGKELIFHPMPDLQSRVDSAIP